VIFFPYPTLFFLVEPAHLGRLVFNCLLDIAELIDKLVHIDDLLLDAIHQFVDALELLVDPLSCFVFLDFLVRFGKRGYL
jgi:hypothetical protein